MRRPARLAALAVAAAVTAVPTAALAHPDHGGSGGELFPGEGVVTEYDKQHDGSGGHLPPRQENVTLVGKGAVKNPKGTAGRVADVFAYGSHAYLNAFRDPVCERGGVHVMDISDLTNPKELVGSFIPTSAGSYAGEGIQVLPIGERDVLIHQNETCPDAAPPAGTSGGINLWDVTNPRRPVNLAMHAGDTDGGPTANTVHSMFAWTSDVDGRTYVVLVDNEESTDVDIMDISDPANPVMVNDTLDLVALFGVDQSSPAGLTSIFSHDMVVKKVGSRYVMSMNYWDGGYVLLDVTDPKRVALVAESDYAALDEERLARGHEISPEGNAHQSELSPDDKFLIGTDEDFNPYRVTATITSGTYSGTSYVAASASDVPAIDDTTRITGGTTFVGLACDPLAEGSGSGTALVERGVCAFQTKLDNIKAAGYSAGIVFNSDAGCDSLVTMLAAGDIPFVFVSRTTGLQLLDSPELACATAAQGSGQSTDISGVFDGWGYVRLFATNIPGRPGAGGSIRQLDTYAIEESQDRAYATGAGDLSVHEVAMDPRGGLAYLSYYTGGLRVLEYGKKGLTEVGVFIDEGGSNLWGVEVYERDGETYVLASDRDLGLYVFQYTP